MKYSVQKIDKAVIIMLEGKLLNEQQTAGVRNRIITELLDQQKKFIFDLKGIEFVNSACLNFLVSAKNKISEHSGEVVLCNVSEQLKKLLSMTRLESFFNVANRTADAILILNYSPR